MGPPRCWAVLLWLLAPACHAGREVVLGEGVTNPHRVRAMSHWQKALAFGAEHGLLDLCQGKPEHPGSQVLTINDRLVLEIASGCP